MTGRIVVTCTTCGTSMDVPDSPFGRVMCDAFELEHKDHRQEESSS